MTENVLLKDNNNSDQLTWPFGGLKAEALGNSDSTEGSTLGTGHVAPSKGHWWHPCRYRDELLNTWIRVCHPVSSRWRAWQNSKPPALEWYQVHESCRDPGILHGYRPEECTWSECWASLFSANNETFNVWSHVVATLYLVWRTIRFAKQWGYLGADDEDFVHSGGDDHYCRVFITFMITACIYPFMSATAHAFCALSHRAKAICFFMDYAAICNYGFGSALLYRAYVLPESWMGAGFTHFFLGAAAVLSLASTFLTCCSRAFVTDVVTQRAMRLAAFTIPYIWVTVPLVIRLSDCWFGLESMDGHSSCLTDETYEAARLHTYQMTVAFLASFTYTTHIPERFFPGVFDLFGQSHNILHVLGVLATILEMEGAIVDMNVRRERLTSANLALVDFGWTVVSPLVVTIGHAVMLVVFSRYVYTHPEIDGLDQTYCCKHDKKKCH